MPGTRRTTTRAPAHTDRSAQNRMDALNAKLGEARDLREQLDVLRDGLRSALKSVPLSRAPEARALVEADITARLSTIAQLYSLASRPGGGARHLRSTP